jgi:hypothetical protein
MVRTRFPSIVSVWRRFLLVFVILLLEFVLLEAGLRFEGGAESSPAFQSLFMQDPDVGHRLRPNARARYTTVEFSTDLAINGEGVRDDEEIGPKAPDERRVLILGDSLVLSVQVAFAQTFGERLEAELNAQGRPVHWRVINGGVQGYGPVDEWLFYDHVAAAFDPDVVVVVAFVGNDAVEAADKEAWLDGRMETVDAGDVALNRLRRVVRSSMVLQQVRLRYDQLKARLQGPGPERPLTTYLTVPPPDVVRGLEVTKRAYGMIAARAARQGARTALVLMPARFQTDDGDYGRLAEIVRESGGELVRNSGSERFEAALGPLGLPMLDLLPVLSAQPDRIGLFFQRNVHLTPRGHEVVAHALFDFLESSGLAASAAR